MHFRLKHLFFLFLALFLALPGYSQKFQKQKPPKDWFLLDPEADQYQGLSVDKAYAVLKGKTAKTVIVAVVDTGIDTDHEDLKSVIWVNEDEIPNNGIDDDKNGYVDDVNGWNFIGGKNSNVNDDTYEITRQYGQLSKKFASLDLSKLSKRDKLDYKRFQSVKQKWEAKRAEDKEQYLAVSRIYSNFQFSIDTLKEFLKHEVTPSALAEIRSNNPNVIFAKSFLTTFFANANRKDQHFCLP